MPARWRSDEVEIVPLTWFDEKDVHAWLLVHLTLAKFPALADVELPVFDEEQWADLIPIERIAALNFMINWFNELTEDTTIDQIRAFTQKLHFIHGSVIRHHPFEFYKDLNWYTHELANQNSVIQQFAPNLFFSLTYMMYSVVMREQLKRRRIVTGLHSQTFNFITTTQLKVAIPKEPLLRALGYRQELRGLERIKNPSQVLRQQMMHWFIHSPMNFLWFLLDENTQDLLPEVWGHPYLLKLREIPDIGIDWQETVRTAVKNRRYTLPEDGYIADCRRAGFGDIETITFKEARANWCYAKVSFSDGLDDLVVFWAETGTDISSGYPTAFRVPTQEDRVMKIVAKVYADSITAKRIAYANPANPRKRGSGGISANSHSSTASSVIYIPRTYYADGGTSGIRRRVGRGTPKRPHPVVGHLRRGNPSPRAIQEALRYGIVLPEGMTFVRPYHTGGIKLDPDKRKVVVRPNS